MPMQKEYATQNAGIRAAHGRAGYSLIEVLIAAVLIAVAIVSVFQAVSHGTRMSRQDFLVRRAYQKLEQILEDPRHSYKGNFYTDAVLDGTDGDTLDPGITALADVVLDDRDTPLDPSDDLIGSAELEVEDIVYSFDIQDIEAACCDDVRAKKLTARIFWMEQGEKDTVELETIISLVNVN
ncbi:MAG: prepilin-type N-terminal cleavage/methylation domain-containing protein [Chitinivibrionales bacterium]|nr:prepilin-type N-terminal cleavage/methylation domain-containing protein [Chitinivibrionales bacterium]MBD3394505.1 prepilin-type N-terminal cleavage/methylation domain-containing protein [Chitinivibrionales bacterium]